MRKIVMLVAVAAALASAGLAVARVRDDAQGVKAVAATFTATTVADSQTKSCTTAGGDTIATTNATYTGTATGDTDLTGDVTLHARSSIDTTTGIGVVQGNLKIGSSYNGQLVAVYNHGNVAGFLNGRDKAEKAGLLANVSAGFSSTGGFTDGKVGGGTAGGSAVEVSPHGCKAASQDHEFNSANGTVSAVTATSITVAGLTCAVPDSLAAKVANIKVGDRAEIRCSFSGGALTLTNVGGKQNSGRK